MAVQQQRLEAGIPEQGLEEAEPDRVALRQQHAHDLPRVIGPARLWRCRCCRPGYGAAPHPGQCPRERRHRADQARLDDPERPALVTRLTHLWSATDLEACNRLIVERMQSPVALIPQLAAHLVAAGGKRLRPLLTLAAARMCGHRGQRHVALAACVEFIHTATLLHDDVVDESALRRGRAERERALRQQGLACWSATSSSRAPSS